MESNTSSTVFYAELPAGATSIATEVFISSNGISMQIDGKWDTGAYMSCIPWKAVKALQLEPRGTERASGTFGDEDVYNTFCVDLTITGGYTFKNLRVIGLPESNIADYMLIGMDVISKGDFLISGFGNGTFSFRVPSIRTLRLT